MTLYLEPNLYKKIQHGIGEDCLILICYHSQFGLELYLSLYA